MIKNQFDSETGEYLETQEVRSRSFTFTRGNSRSDARVSIEVEKHDYLKDIYDRVHTDSTWGADLSGCCGIVSFHTNTDVTYRDYEKAIEEVLNRAENDLSELLDRVRELKTMNALTKVMPEFGEK